MLVTFNNVTKGFAGHELYEDVSFTIKLGEKLGLIGRNGSGKSTIFRLLSGEETADEGEIARAKNLRIGFIPQHPTYPEDMSLREFVLEAFGDIREVQTELRQTEDAMARHTEQNDESERLLVRYTELHERMERLGGENFEWRADRVLQGLGFEEKQWSQPMKTLSGGQQQRALLCQLLAGSHDLMLLDEPTNHMDMPSCLWLEEYLRETESAILLISHDRALLQGVVNGVLDLELRHLTRYDGSFTHFQRQKEEALERWRKEYEAQQAHIKRTEEFIRRNIAGQKTKQAQGRRKQLARLERVERPREDSGGAGISFGEASRTGKIVIEAEGVAKRFGKRTLFEDVHLKMMRGDKIALVGRNGVGKSTLIQLLMAQQTPDNGTVTHGHNLDIGYFDQHQQDFHPDNSVLNEVWAEAPDMQLQEVRDLLGRFLFSGEKVEQKVAKLSGGEKSRLMMVKLLLRSPNVLIMDEPTNHLDTFTVEALEEALGTYQGALMIVSHDRQFIENVADRVFLLEDGKLEELWSGVSDYIERLKSTDEATPTGTAKQDPEPIATPVPAKKEPKREAKPSGKGKASPSSKQPDKKPEKPKEPDFPPVEDIEDEIEAIEFHVEKLTQEMSTPEVYDDPERAKKLQAEVTEAMKMKEEVYAKWEAAEKAWTTYRRAMRRYKEYFKR